MPKLSSETYLINYLTLTFPKGLERSFRKYYFSASLRQVRIASLLGVFFYAIFGVLDAWLVPEVKIQLWYIRYAVVCPMVFLVFALSFSRHFEKCMQPAIAIAVLAAGLGIIKMILIAPYPASHTYYAGLILVFFYGYTFYRLRFFWATLVGWIIVVVYEIAAIWLNPTDIPVLINNNFFFLTGNIFGMFASYSIEYYVRKNYLQARLLDAEKKKVEKANLQLEDRVEQRTAQLENTNKELTQEISERNRAEDALRESEEKYRRLVDNADTAIFIAQDGVVKFPNPMALEITQFTAEELAQKPFAELIHPDDRAAIVERHKLRLEGKDVPNSYDFQAIDKHGKAIWAHINTVVINWEGRPATLNFLRDISTQKELVAKLQRAQKMEAIGTLAGGVAHDLNNVLSGIVSYPELLLLDIPADSPLHKPIVTIQESGQKAAAIVQDLLTLARRGVLVSEVVNLNQIIRQYLHSLEYEKMLSYNPGVKVKQNLESNLLNIIGSPVHLSKTIMNLVSNAAEAMPSGGLISINTQSRYLEEALEGYETIEAGKYIAVTVSDNGKGISEVDIDKIFEPFYTKKVMGRSGTGLGMSVVWGTVKDHLGYIDLKSKPGEGTTFTLYFPASHKKMSDSASPIDISDYMGNGESVLIIDDVKEQRDIAGGILSKLGYEVNTAASGEEAVQYMRENTADLLILDMIMDPGIDGLETFEKILQLHPEQKAIIASGYTESDRVKKTLNLGAALYLKKPYSLEKVGLAVRTGLSEGG